jgi:hypothetical protein
MKIKLELVEYRMIPQKRESVVEIDIKELYEKLQNEELDPLCYESELASFLLNLNEKSYTEELKGICCSSIYSSVIEGQFGEFIKEGIFESDLGWDEEYSMCEYTKVVENE